jgi:sarcosine oxidase delta subunit
MSKIPQNTKVLTRIYILKDPENQQVRYVGKTVKSLKARLTDHLYERKNKFGLLNHKINWVKSIKNKGLEPIIEEVDSCPWDESQNLEMYWISQFRAWGFNLVNQTDGGEGCLGIKLSKERVDHLRKINSKAVVKYSLEGIKLEEYPSCHNAADNNIGTNHTKIAACCRLVRRKNGKFRWRFKSDNIESLEILSKKLVKEETKTNQSNYWKNRLQKDIFVYNLLGEYVGQWKNISTCAKDLKMSRTGVSGFLSGRAKIPKKYIFLRDRDEEKVQFILENIERNKIEIKEFLEQIKPDKWKKKK